MIRSIITSFGLVWLSLVSVSANTEIINFATSSLSHLAELPPTLTPSASKIPTLRLNEPQTSQLILSANHSEDAHAIFALDLHHSDLISWHSKLSIWLGTYEKKLGIEMRTVRLCWPASHPTNFHLYLHSNPLVQSSIPLVLVQASYSGVPLPSSSAALTTPTVPYTILLEPVHLGFIPASTGPILMVLVLLLALLVALRVPGRVVNVLERLAKDVDGATERKKTE